MIQSDRPSRSAVVASSRPDQTCTSLRSLAARQRRRRVESGALLAGLIFDDRGSGMTPTYTVRRGNRHRYYVSRGSTGHRERRTGALRRVGADDIEPTVVGALARALSRDDLATATFTGAWSTEIRAIVRDYIERIVLHHQEVEIILKSRRAGGATPEQDDPGSAPIILKVELTDPRPRARKEILIPGDVGSALRHIDHALLLALARARSWMRALRHGEYADTAEIARRFGLSDAHVRRLVRFAYLAPDIVEAIVEGHQPRALTVKLLLRGIPLAWSDQRAAFGVTC